MDGRACWVTVHGVARIGHDLATKPPPPSPGLPPVSKVILQPKDGGLGQVAALTMEYKRATDAESQHTL